MMDSLPTASVLDFVIECSSLHEVRKLRDGTEIVKRMADVEEQLNATTKNVRVHSTEAADSHSSQHSMATKTVWMLILTGVDAIVESLESTGVLDVKGTILTVSLHLAVHEALQTMVIEGKVNCEWFMEAYRGKKVHHFRPVKMSIVLVLKTFSRVH